VLQFLAGKAFSALDHPPYPPDLAPANFWLLPKLRRLLKGKHFSDVKDLKLYVEKKMLTDIPVQDFKKLF
jgi:hypothetical protein